MDGGGQGALHAVEDELVHGAGIPEAHFGLGRMHIHIHGARVDGQEQAQAGLAAAVQHVPVGFAQGVADHLVAHEAAIDEGVLGVLGLAGPGGVDDQAGERKGAGRDVDGTGLADEFLTKDGAYPLFQIGPGQLQAGAAVVGQGEGHVRMSQGDALEIFGAMAKFGAFGLEEFAPGRGVVIQVAHFHHGAGHQGGRLGLGAGSGPEFPGVVATPGPAGEAEAGHGGHRGQGFTAKSQACHAFQISQGADLGGGVAGQGQGQVFPGNAAAVIGDADQFHPPFFQVHLNRRAAGIQGVFQ